MSAPAILQEGYPDWQVFESIEVEVLWTTPIQSWQEVSAMVSGQLIDKAVALGAEMVVFEKTFVSEDEGRALVTSRAIALGGGSPRILSALEHSDPERVVRISWPL